MVGGCRCSLNRDQVHVGLTAKVEELCEHVERQYNACFERERYVHFVISGKALQTLAFNSSIPLRFLLLEFFFGANCMKKSKKEIDIYFIKLHYLVALYVLALGDCA